LHLPGALGPAQKFKPGRNNRVEEIQSALAMELADFDFRKSD
jgi:hypothetical protein